MLKALFAAACALLIPNLGWADGPPPTPISVAVPKAPPAAQTNHGLSGAVGPVFGWMDPGNNTTNLAGVGVELEWEPLLTQAAYIRDISFVVDTSYLTGTEGLSSSDNGAVVLNGGCGAGGNGCSYSNGSSDDNGVSSDHRLDVVVGALNARWDAAPLLFGSSAEGVNLSLEAGPAFVYVNNGVHSQTNFAGNFAFNANVRFLDVFGIGANTGYVLVKDAPDLVMTKILLSYRFR